MIAEMILREERRNKNMISQYTKELEELPKGSIKRKQINGKFYFYLNFREGKKVVSKYIGKDESSVAVVEEQIERRNQIEKIIKRLNEERAQLKKMEAML